MTIRKSLRMISCVALAAVATGCIGFERKSVTGPSAAGLSALSGSWSSSTVIPAPSSCSDFRWNVTEQTATSARGSFSATCAGDLRLAGTAQGTLSGSVITWSAQGTATRPGLPACDIALTGTAEILTDSVRVPYSGRTCLGDVSGVETLRRN